MKKQELEQLAREGKLFVCKSHRGIATRHKYIYDNNEPLYLPNGELNEKAFEIKEVKTIKFDRYYHGAKTEGMLDGQSYRITKNDYYNFLKLGAKGI